MTRGVYDALEAAGHKPWIITTGDVSQEERRRVKILGWRVELGKILGMMGSSASAAFTWAGRGEISRFLTDEKIDLVHLTAPYGSLGKRILREASRQGIAKVATFLIYRPADKASNYLFKLYLRRSVAYLDRRLALSNAAKEFAQAILPDGYEVIPAGVDIERFKPEGEKIKEYLDGMKNIFFVGRLDRRKGVETLLKAFAMIKENFQEARLIIGGRGPEEGKLKNLTKALELRDVVFVGYITDENLAKYYATADICCFPSWGDQCFGVVLLEGMASGRPVVASDIPGYRGVLTGDLANLLFPPRDYQALAETILVLLEDDSLREDYGRKSRKIAEEEYSWEKVGERILDIYHQLV